MKGIAAFIVLMIFTSVALTSNVIAQGSQTYTNSGSYTVPSNVQTLTVQCWGSGGKGTTRSTTGGGGGGGGGAFACSTFTVTPGSIIPVNVGLGGNLSVQNGQPSFFGSPAIVLAAGGEGQNNNTVIAGNGGAASASLGFIKFSGGNGGQSTGNGAGGGGAAGLNGNGFNGSANWGGNGNGLNSGRGGDRRTGNGNGRNGFNYGGGGGGARRTNGTRNGGRGANGLVVVTPTIWGSPVLGPNPSSSNPYTSGQVADPNVSVSGISYGPGLIPVNDDDRFNARGFVTSNNVNNAINANDYFEFTITPNPGFKINFNSFLFSATRSSIGPSNIRVRSSANNYINDIGPNPTTSVGNINLTSTLYQDVVDPITFRVYGMGSGNATGELSIDNFFFFGTVVPKNYISSFSPIEACEGDVVTLNGLNLNGTTTVKFDGQNASFTQISDTQIDAIVPSGANSGIISISNGSDLALSNAQAYTVDCENTGEFKGGYNSGNIRFSGILWNLDQVMTGNMGSDFRVGSRSLRFRGRNNSQARMLENKPNGIGHISFKYRRFGNDAQVEWLVEYSQNNGASWIQVGQNFSASENNDAQFFNETVNISGDVRIRIRHAAGGNGINDRRLNIDELVISNYNEISTIDLNTIPVQPGEFTASTPSVCRGDIAVEYTVPFAAGVSYTWNYSGTGATISGNGHSVTVDFSSSATSGNLSVTAVNICGSSQARTLAITVDPAPAATITPTYCLPNGNIGLTSSSAASYLWNTGETTSYIEVDQAGTYSLTLGNATGCSAGASIVLGTELVTNGTFSAGNTGFVTGYSYRADVGGQTELWPEGTYAIVPNANNVHTAFRGRERNNGSGNIMVINGSPALGATVWSQNNIGIQPNTTYYFSAWGMSVVNGNNAVLQFEINGNQVGTIAYLPNGYTNPNGPYNWVRFYGSWNSGPSTSADISIINLNTVLGGNDFALDDISFSTLAPVALEASPVANGNIPVCEGAPLFLNANTVGGVAPFTYSWQGPNGFTSLIANPTITSNAQSSQEGAYELTVTDALGCTYSANTSVTVNTIPEDKATLPAESVICSGTSTQINITDSESGVFYQLVETISGNVIGTTVNGNGAGVSLQTGVIDSTTTFVVTATRAASGCSRQLSNSVTINVTQTPHLNITNQAACSGLVDLTLPAVTSGSEGIGTLTYWQDLAATSALVDPTSVNTGTYFIKSEVAGCVDIESVEVVVTSNPNADFEFVGSPYCSSGNNPSPSITGSAGVFSSNEVSYFINFEGAGETKTAYASGNVSLSGMQWNLTQALIGTGGTDWKFGSRALRLQGSTTSAATMVVDKPNGIGIISFNYRRFSSDAQVTWKVEYSTNGGGTWTQAGNDFMADNSVKTFYAAIHVSGNARIRIVHASGGTTTSVRRLNVDHISLTDFSSNPLVFASSATGEIDLENSTPGTYLIANTITPSGACNPVLATRVITITPSPVASFQYGSNSLCQSINAAPVLPTFLDGGQGGSFSRSSNLLSLNTGTGAINIAASIPGNYAVVNFLSATGGCAEVRDTAFITINPYTFEGSISSATSTTEICLGESAQLFASGTSYLSVLLSENFNGNINSWTRINNSIGGNVNNASWTLRPNNYNSDVQFRSNDNSQFYLSHSRNQNGSITETALISPSFSTVGYSSLQLDFWHYFRFQNRPGENARVEISTDGGNWTTLQSFTSTQGSGANFQNVSVDISAYIGYPNVYVRFNYYAQGRARYWAIDNVTISGNTTNYSFAWTSDPNSYNSAEQNPVIAPTEDAFYIVNTTNTFGCSIVNSPMPISVKPIGELITTLTPQPICSGAEFTYEPEANLSGTTFTWIRPAVAGIDNLEILDPQTDNPSEMLENTSNSSASVTYIYTTTYDGCAKVEQVIVDVHPLPFVTVSGSESICNGSAATISASASGGTGSLSYQWLPDIGLDDALNQITTASPLSEFQDYTVTVTDENNCSVESDIVTITNIGFAGTPGLWLGTADSDWNNCLNWDDGKVPSVLSDVLISDLAVNTCELSGIQTCNTLTIESSGDGSLEFVISGSAQLTVNQNIFVNKLSGNDTLRIILEDFASLTCNDFRLVGSALGERNAQLVNESANTTLNILGDLTLGAGGYIDLNDNDFNTDDATIKLSGDLQHDGDAFDFDQGNGILELNGSSNQQIFASNGLNLQNLKINKVLGGDVFLNDNISVESSLELLHGKLDLGGYVLTLGSSSQVGVINGANADSYVIAWNGADNGTITHHIPVENQNYFFPVGDENDYTPFDVILDQGTLNSATINLKLVANAHPNLVGDETIFLNRYWIVEPSGISNPLYSAEYVFANHDVVGAAALLFPAKYNAEGWQSSIESASNAMIGSGVVNTANNTILWTGITTFSEFTGIGNGTALPIELLDFSAEQLAEHVELNWITSSEINNSHFIIERSIDTKLIDEIARVEGAGNSNTIRTYSTIDINPMEGISYYRLKQVDFNGDFSHSEWVAVNYSGSNHLEIEAVYCDKANGSLLVRCSNQTSDKGVFNLIDASGRLITTYNLGGVSSNWNGSIPSQKLMAGSYILRFDLEGKSAFKKFVVH